MRLLAVNILLALSFPGIVSNLEENMTKCGDFFSQETSPVIPGILEDSVTKNNRYKIICQKYKNKIRYATLYDTTSRIPVFSAYKYTGKKEFAQPEIPRTWMTELQLEKVEKPLDAEMRMPFSSQAKNEDYWTKDTSTGECTRGTLFSTNHAADRETAESIFTLTNTVPEKVGFRERISALQNSFQETLDNNCRDANKNTVAYVLAGVVPSEASMWNNRLNVPSFLWMAFCCYNSETKSWVSRTYRDENKKDSNNIVTIKNLSELEQFLQKKFRTNVSPKLFKNNCE